MQQAAATQAAEHTTLAARYAALQLQVASLEGRLAAEAAAAAEAAGTVARLESTLRTATKDKEACERRLQLVERDAMHEQVLPWWWWMCGTVCIRNVCV